MFILSKLDDFFFFLIIIGGGLLVNSFGVNGWVFTNL